MTPVGATLVSASLAGVAFEAGRAPEEVFAAGITLVEDVVAVGTLVGAGVGAGSVAEEGVSAGIRTGVMLSAGGGTVAGHTMVAGLGFPLSDVARSWRGDKTKLSLRGELGEFSFAQITTTVSIRHNKRIPIL